MIGNVSLDEIEAVRRHVAEALVGSSAGSTLSEQKQDELLAQACVEACDILARWVSDPAWSELRPAGRGPITDIVSDWQRVQPFLEPLGTTLGRLSDRQPGVSGTPDPKKYIDDLIKDLETTVRRYRWFSREELFKKATDRIQDLQSSVCGVAADFAKGSKTRAKRRALARTALKAVGSFLLSAALILGGVTPEALAHDIPEWGHEAVKVLVVHHAAQTAQPSVRVAPPQLGPRLG